MNLLYAKAYNDYNIRANEIFKIAQKTIEDAKRKHKEYFGASLQQKLAFSAYVYAEIFAN